MRKFYFENSIGERWNLNQKSNFFWNPGGLGTANKSEYERIGNGFFTNSLLEADQINIVGEIAFMDDSYASYDALMDWLCKGYPITFVRSEDGINERRCDIEIDYIERGEKKNAFLNSPCSFFGTTPWYDATPIVLDFTVDDETEYMIYDFPIEAYYSLSNVSNSINIMPNGHFPAAIKLIAQGPFSDPILTAKKTSNEEEIGRMELTGLNIGAEAYLLYSTVPNDSGIYIVSGGAKTDISNFIDTNYDSFFKLPPNEQYTVKFESVGESPSATLYVYRYYR